MIIIKERKISGVGFIGEGEYSAKKDKKALMFWTNMLFRCYSERKIFHRTYKGATVCEEWHSFQNFAKWHYENYYIIHDKRMELDKDILVKENKYYSPDTCVYVPSFINRLFTRSNRKRGEYPIGVSKSGDRIISRCWNQLTGKRMRLGSFRKENVKEAFLAYKIYKEAHIKEIANHYKNEIPQKLYDAMYNYKVEITD